jgi:hypothetical protein
MWYSDIIITGNPNNIEIVVIWSTIQNPIRYVTENIVSTIISVIPSLVIKPKNDSNFLVKLFSFFIIK